MLQHKLQHEIKGKEMRAWPDPGLSQEAHLLLGEFRDILGWPKSSFGFFHTCRPARIPCVRRFYKGQIQKVNVILDLLLLCLNFFGTISNQSILKEINPENSLERLMLKLKLQYFGHLMRRADSLEMTLMLGKIEGKRKRK